jgi:hypothetical protein
MKQLLLSLLLVVIVAPSLALAQTPVQQRDRDQVNDPEGNTVRNQNQIQVQNEGEDPEMLIQTQEQQRLQDQDGTPRSTTAREHMSQVEEKVEELLSEDRQGGIGPQVREVAQAQQQAQTKIQTALAKLESKTGFMRRLFGPDLNAVDELNQQMEQNQVRIQELEQLATQTQNQAEETQLQEMIQALVQQNTALGEQVRAEEANTGMFGWLMRLFNR